MKKIIFLIFLCTVYVFFALSASVVFAREVPLCMFPAVKQVHIQSGCANAISQVNILERSYNYPYLIKNLLPIPPQLSVRVVYLQAVTMYPHHLMRQRKDSDIHLEVDIHAKKLLVSRGFAPGDWMPYAKVSYSVYKIDRKNEDIACGARHKPQSDVPCSMLPMVASDGVHYGDNVKLDGPGFYVFTVSASSNPQVMGWHTESDSKILGTEYVKWSFTKQKYLLVWTGIGKRGGY